MPDAHSREATSNAEEDAHSRQRIRSVGRKHKRTPDTPIVPTRERARPRQTATQAKQQKQQQSSPGKAATAKAAAPKE